MALINCSECGKEVSDMAVSCPGCGYGVANNNPVIIAANEETKQKKTGKTVAWLVFIALCVIVGVAAYLHFGDTGGGSKELEKLAIDIRITCWKKGDNAANSFFLEQSAVNAKVIKEIGANGTNGTILSFKITDRSSDSATFVIYLYNKDKDVYIKGKAIKDKGKWYIGHIYSIEGA